jgi:hypothetical protein
MCDLVTALRLSPAKLKEGDYTQKRRWNGGKYNIFEKVSLRFNMVSKRTPAYLKTHSFDSTDR